MAPGKLQNTLINSAEGWIKHWKIKVKNKHEQITFTFELVSLSNKILPTSGIVRYLRIYLNRRLTWKDLTDKKKRKKIKQLNIILVN